MSIGEQWTRAELLRRAAGAGLVLAGGEKLLRQPSAAHAAHVSAAATGSDVRRFVTRPDLVPPVVRTLHHSGATAPGLLFLAPSSGPGQRGTLIVDDAGDPIYFHPTTPVTAMNFRAALYKGKPVLTWWEGKTQEGLGTGTHVILDSSYRVVARLPAGGGRPSDLHEFLLTSRGTALVTSWEKVRMDLSSLGGSSSFPVIGGVVQELELPSGRVLFEWRSLDHVALAESHAAIGANAFDYFHVNSIELDSQGDLLVSARNTWAVYKIDRGSGDVVWRLGGKKSDFAMGPGTTFAWQHDARHQDDDRLVSLFDDGAAPKAQPQSKGLVLALDTKAMRATLHRKYTHRPSVSAHALGSVQVLQNTNVLVGWGTAPYFTEFAADGTVLLDARLPKGGQNYRTLRQTWVGRPSVPPAIAARTAASGQVVHASWNGATEIADWQLETGPKEASMIAGAKLPKDGFETVLPLPHGSRFAAVRALDKSGALLGTSPTIALRG